MTLTIIRSLVAPTFLLACSGCLSGGGRHQPETRAITVAAVSMESHIRRPEHNLARVETWTRRAAAAGADLVLFPEATLSGWWASREVRAFAEPIDGPAVQRLAKLAAELHIIIAVGLTERAGDRAHITHVVLDQGGLIGLHRKKELSPGEEKTWDAGDDVNVLRVHGIPIGIAICYESVHPRICAALAGAGARIILAPYANGTDPDELLDGRRKYPAARARENGVWYVACDAPARKDDRLMRGAAYVINPAGDVVAITPADANGEAMVVYRIELEARAHAGS